MQCSIGICYKKFRQFPDWYPTAQKFQFRPHADPHSTLESANWEKFSIEHRTGSFSCFCLSLGSRTPWGLFTRGSSYPGVFSSCIVLKHFSRIARFPLFTDFFSNCDFSRILCIDYYMHVCNKTHSLKCKKIIIRRKEWEDKNNMRRIRREEQEVNNNKG
jgi:hypothetical protein